MRTTLELIAELEAEATQHRYVALIIGFEHSTVPIMATDDNRLQLLNDAVNVGGHPLGLIAMDQNGKQLTFKTRVYPEHTGDAAEQAEECLDLLSRTLGEHLAAQFGSGAHTGGNQRRQRSWLPRRSTLGWRCAPSCGLGMSH